MNAWVKISKGIPDGRLTVWFCILLCTAVILSTVRPVRGVGVAGLTAKLWTPARIQVAKGALLFAGTRLATVEVGAADAAQLAERLVEAGAVEIVAENSSRFSLLSAMPPLSERVQDVVIDLTNLASDGYVDLRVDIATPSGETLSCFRRLQPTSQGGGLELRDRGTWFATSSFVTE